MARARTRNFRRPTAGQRAGTVGGIWVPYGAVANTSDAITVAGVVPPQPGQLGHTIDIDFTAAGWPIGQARNPADCWVLQAGVWIPVTSVTNEFGGTLKFDVAGGAITENGILSVGSYKPELTIGLGLQFAGCYMTYSYEV